MNMSGYDSWLDKQASDYWDDCDDDERERMKEARIDYECEIYEARRNEYIERKLEAADLKRKELKESGPCSKPYWHL